MLQLMIMWNFQRRLRMKLINISITSLLLQLQLMTMICGSLTVVPIGDCDNLSSLSKEKSSHKVELGDKNTI